MPRFLTPPEIAKFLRTDPHKVLDWIGSGALKAVNLSDGARPRWKVSPEDLQKFLNTRSNQTATPATKRKRRDLPQPSRQWV